MAPQGFWLPTRVAPQQASVTHFLGYWIALFLKAQCPTGCLTTCVRSGLIACQEQNYSSYPTANRMTIIKLQLMALVIIVIPFHDHCLGTSTVDWPSRETKKQLRNGPLECIICIFMLTCHHLCRCRHMQMDSMSLGSSKTFTWDINEIPMLYSPYIEFLLATEGTRHRTCHMNTNTQSSNIPKPRVPQDYIIIKACLVIHLFLKNFTVPLFFFVPRCVVFSNWVSNLIVSCIPDSSLISSFIFSLVC